MNPSDILMYGHRTVENTLAAFPSSQVSTPGACGYWSVKDLVAHLSSFELFLVEILENMLNACPTPQLDAYIREGLAFNDNQVDQRAALSMEQVLQEYRQAHEHVMSAAKQVAPEMWRQRGVLPWYGEEYDLEDFIVYTFYGHKREHCGQIAVFSDQFK